MPAARYFDSIMPLASWELLGQTNPPALKLEVE
jgi:hypothetical protein